MTYMLSAFLSANSFEGSPNVLHVYVTENPGSEVKEYGIPLPHVGRMTDDPDDQWLRDLFVAAIEAL